MQQIRSCCSRLCIITIVHILLTVNDGDKVMSESSNSDGKGCNHSLIQKFIFSMRIVFCKNQKSYKSSSVVPSSFFFEWAGSISSDSCISEVGFMVGMH